MTMAHTLSDREKLFLAIGGGVAALLVILVLGILPFLDSLTRLDHQVEARQEELKDVRTLQQEYLRVKSQLTGSETRFKQGKTFSLFQFMEGLAGAQATPEQLVYIRPKPDLPQDDIKVSSLEVRLQNLDLGQTVRILEKLEGAPAVVRVKSLSLKKRFDNPGLMDLEMTVNAYTPAGG